MGRVVRGDCERFLADGSVVEVGVEVVIFSH